MLRVNYSNLNSNSNPNSNPNSNLNSNPNSNPPPLVHNIHITKQFLYPHVIMRVKKEGDDSSLSLSASSDHCLEAPKRPWGPKMYCYMYLYLIILYFIILFITNYYSGCTLYFL